MRYQLMEDIIESQSHEDDDQERIDIASSLNTETFVQSLENVHTRMEQILAYAPQDQQESLRVSFYDALNALLTQYTSQVTRIVSDEFIDSFQKNITALSSQKQETQSDENE